MSCTWDGSVPLVLARQALQMKQTPYLGHSRLFSGRGQSFWIRDLYGPATGTMPVVRPPRSIIATSDDDSTSVRVRSRGYAVETSR